MVRSSDNETALYQELDYLQSKGDGVRSTSLNLFLALAGNFTVSGEGCTVTPMSYCNMPLSWRASKRKILFKRKAM